MIVSSSDPDERDPAFFCTAYFGKNIIASLAQDKSALLVSTGGADEIYKRLSCQ